MKRKFENGNRFYTGRTWGIVAITSVAFLILLTVLIGELDGFPGILTIILAFIPLLIAWLITFLWKVMLVVAGVVSVTALIMNLTPRFRDKKGLIMSVIAIVAYVVLLVLLKEAVFDMVIDVFQHVT